MNYAELREEAEELCEIWGYSNTQRKPNWYSLVNKAYLDLCWDTEVIRGPEIGFPTVAGQREYVIGGPTSVSKFFAAPGNEANSTTLGSTCTQDVKSFLDVLTTDNRRITPRDENWLRRDAREWLTNPPGVPTACWTPRPNVMSFYPTPDGVYNLILYCVMGPTPLSADDDVPALWERFHQAIPIRAAYRHAMKYAKGEAREVLAARDSEYQVYAADLKQQQMEDSGMDTPRFVQWPEPERMYI